MTKRKKMTIYERNLTVDPGCKGCTKVKCKFHSLVADKDRVIDRRQNSYGCNSLLNNVHFIEA